MIVQYDCLPGNRSDEVTTTVIDREDQECSSVAQMAQRMGSVTSEESLSDDRDRVEERSVE